MRECRVDNDAHRADRRPDPSRRPRSSFQVVARVRRSVSDWFDGSSSENVITASRTPWDVTIAAASPVRFSYPTGTTLCLESSFPLLPEHPIRVVRGTRSRSVFSLRSFTRTAPVRRHASIEAERRRGRVGSDHDPRRRRGLAGSHSGRARRVKAVAPATVRSEQHHAETTLANVDRGTGATIGLIQPGRDTIAVYPGEQDTEIGWLGSPSPPIPDGQRPSVS